MKRPLTWRSFSLGGTPLDLYHERYRLFSSFLDRPRELVIALNYIAYENKDTLGDIFTKLLQQDIIALK